MQRFRFSLIALLLVTGLFLKQAWDRDYGTTLGRAAPDPPVAGAPAPDPRLPAPEASLQAGGGADLPTTPEFAKALPDVSEAQLNEWKAGLLRVRTDVLELAIDPLGGTMDRLELLRYPVSVQEPEIPLRLLDERPGSLYLLQGGLLSAGGSVGAPHTQTRYRAEQREYLMREGQETLEVRLRWEEAGLRVDKVFLFRRGDYLFEVFYEVRNLGAQPWTGLAYAQLKRGAHRAAGGFAERATFTGMAFSTPEDRYEKISFDDIKSERRPRSENAWIAILQHYFLGALLPGSAEQEYSYYMKPTADGHYLAGSFTPALRLAPGRAGALRTVFTSDPRSNATWPPRRPAWTWPWITGSCGSWPSRCSGSWRFCMVSASTGGWPSSC